MYSILKSLWTVQVVVATVFGAELKGDYPPISFTCPPLPPLSRSARNVYELRPQDIKVIMALGDSITAGTDCLSTECCLTLMILNRKPLSEVRHSSSKNSYVGLMGLSHCIHCQMYFQYTPGYAPGYTPDIPSGV